MVLWVLTTSNTEPKSVSFVTKLFVKNYDNLENRLCRPNPHFISKYESRIYNKFSLTYKCANLPLNMPFIVY